MRINGATSELSTKFCAHHFVDIINLLVSHYIIFLTVILVSGIYIYIYIYHLSAFAVSIERENEREDHIGPEN